MQHYTLPNSKQVLTKFEEVKVVFQELHETRTKHVHSKPVLNTHNDVTLLILREHLLARGALGWTDRMADRNFTFYTLLDIIVIWYAHQPEKYTQNNNISQKFLILKYINWDKHKDFTPSVTCVEH